MNFLKNTSAITFYFTSMICFLVGYLIKDSQPIVYVITMILGVVLLIVGYLRRTNK